MSQKVAISNELDRQGQASGRATVAAPAFPSKAELEAELAAEQAAAAAAAATASGSVAPGRRNSTVQDSNNPGTARANEESGPSEITLIAYSAFMGLSSLLFGGLTLLQAKNGSSQAVDPSKPLTVREILLQGLQLMLTRAQDRLTSLFAVFFAIDPETLITGLLVLSIVFVIAHTTRPNDASFRSYLTDLQLHEHLRHIKKPLPAPELEQERKSAQTANGENGASKPARSESPPFLPEDCQVDEAKGQHVSTFANRISISIRTPPYVRHDYFLFSLIMVKHPIAQCLPSVSTRARLQGKTSELSTTKGSKRRSCANCGVADASDHRGKASWYVGVFGRWFTGAWNVHDSSPLPNNSGNRQSDAHAEEYGVLAVETGEGSQRRRSSVKVEGVNDTTMADEAAHSISAGVKSSRKKKNNHRLRPSQLNAGQPRSHPNAQKRHADDRQKAQAASNHPPSPQPPSPNSATFHDQHVQAAASINPEAQAATLAAIESTIKEYEAQIASLKTTTDASQEQLQSQLDELRQRKRDDDTARQDLKTRMKSLEEGKRHAEASRREAEKRFRAAQTLRQTAQAKIDSSKDSLRSFVGREQSSKKWLESVLVDGNQRRNMMSAEQAADEGAKVEVEATLEELQAHILRLETLVAQEQEGLDAAQQDMRDRIAIKARQASAMSLSANAGSQPIYGAYGHGADASYGQEQWYNGHAEPDFGYFGPNFAGSRRASEDRTNSKHDGFDNGQHLYGYSTGMPHAETTHSSPFLNSRPLEGSAAVASTQTPRQPRSLHDISTAYTSSSRRQSTIPPTSPFSMDLLPSNLFQNLDDDAHPGVMPRNRSETIEAALGQFGLDNSDQSDIDGNQSDRDTVDGVLEAKLDPLSEHGSEDESSAPKNRRSWWGSKSRQASKDRPNTDVMSSSAGSEGDGNDGSGKRRSFGVWPRLSLNQLTPGAKSARKQSDLEALRGRLPEGYGSQGYLGHADRSEPWETNNSNQERSVSRSSSKVIPTQFDAVRRAFETSNPPDEEEGRRSWSAFDQWSQRHGMINQGLRFNESNGSSTALQSSALSRFRAWPDDVFQPLSQTTSAESRQNTAGRENQPGEQSNEDVASESLSASQGSRSNRSRFAFWNQNSKVSVNSATSGGSTGSEAPNSAAAITATSARPGSASGPDSSLSVTSTEGVNGTDIGGQLGTSPASSTASKPKRSFRWTRRRESTSNSKESANASVPSISSVQESDDERSALDDGIGAPVGSPASSGSHSEE
ncbi:unnamed protein product [Sympodiomycopsis kandeliae]